MLKAPIWNPTIMGNKSKEGGKTWIACCLGQLTIKKLKDMVNKEVERLTRSSACCDQPKQFRRLN